LELKIVDAQAIPIRIPLKKPFTIAVGTLTHCNHVLVRMTDDEGRVGWGETTTFLEVYGYDQNALCQALTDHLIPAVKGLDPHDMALIHQRMDHSMPYNLMAKAGIDFAAHDLIAQAANLPIHAMIGGRRVQQIPLIAGIDIIPADQAFDRAREIVNQGYRTVKIKIGKDPRQDIERVRSVRKAVGEEITLRVDGNCGYDRNTAIRLFSHMEDYHLEWIEQPLPAWDLHGLALLADRLDTPIAVDESMYTPHQAQQCIALGAADVVNIKIVKCGGIYRSQKIAALCAAASIPCFLGGCIETTPGTATAAHFYVATPNMVSAAEIYGSAYYMDDITEEGFTIIQGELQVPIKPGLGVVMDEEKISRYRTDR
jgi:L-Ala-D/L-Glu epimerase